MTGFRLGRLFGITILVELDWFIVFFVMLAAFAVLVFPVALPGENQLVYVLLASVVTLLFYASLLLHEFSHSIAARTRGLRVDSITLPIFGGIARMRGEPKTPLDELVITGIGPLTSAALAVMFAGASVGAVEVGARPSAVAVLRYLAILNAAVAALNLLPVFPLDGGRLVRALLWRLTGSLDRASRIVIRASTTVSYLLICGCAARCVPPPRERSWCDWEVRSRRASPRSVHEGPRSGGWIAREEWPTRWAGDTMTPLSTLEAVDPQDSMTRVMDVLRASASAQVLGKSGDQLRGTITAVDVALWLEHERPDGKS